MAWRNMLRGKGFSAINIFGLAIGIAAFLIIMLYVKNELSFDRFHSNAERIYRVAIEIKSKEGLIRSPQITAAVIPDLVTSYPEIENAVRMRTPQSGYISFGNRSLLDNKIVYADSSFFTFFSFKLLKGNPRNVLNGPYSIVLTESEALNLFRNDDPMGKMVNYEGKSYMVTGIAADPPANSHIKFNSLISFITLYNDSRLFMGWNGGMQYYGYLLLRKSNSFISLQSKFPKLMYEKVNRELESFGVSMRLFLNPLTRIYLHSGLPGEIGPTGNLQGIRIFSLVALFILIIACFNFININVSMASLRNHEVGIRKVNGAAKLQLVILFLSETLLQVLIACIFAFLFADLILKPVNQLLGKELDLLAQLDIEEISIILGIILFITLLAGSSPAWLMASFSPAGVIREQLIPGKPRSFWRNIMVSLQFMITGFLLAVTAFISLQMRYIQQKDLGFDRQNIMVIPLFSEQVKAQTEMFRTELLSIPGVTNVAAATDFPGRSFTSNGYWPEGRKEPIMINAVDVDEHYLPTLGLSIVKGRNFSSEFTTDKKGYLINETLARQLGWDDAIGKKISRDGDHTVIGVVKDFHFASLHEQIAPLIFTMEPYMGFDYFIMKIGKGKTNEVMKKTEQVWQKLFPGSVFLYSFLDQEFENIYRGERKFGSLMLFFSCLAILIASMGLFGLATLSTVRRTKEIGIRKAMGASINQIMQMLMKEFSLLVLLSNFLMWPFAWIAVKKWLQEFAYSIQPVIWPFLVILVAMLMLAAVAVGWRSYMAAQSNPVLTLRHE